ncbi:hypothetical protein ACS0TY_014285 [Phlomoides rotata]
MADLVDENDEDCKNKLRMDRNNFYRLCYLLKHIGGLTDSKYINVYEKGCLGALDGTYIDVHVPSIDKGRYRNRKGQVSVNVLVVCDINMSFSYVLTGWEGSAVDSSVLRDTINRENKLKVPKGLLIYVEIQVTTIFVTTAIPTVKYETQGINEMVVDPLEVGLDEFLSEQPGDQNDNVDYIESLESTAEWSQWRDTIAQTMFK